MNTLPGRRNLVIGVGNPDRGDDAIGLLVARQVKQTAPMGVSVIEASGDGINLMELWNDQGTVIIIDAAHCHGVPGTIFRFDAGSAPLPVRTFPRSTHAFGLADTIELARVLNRLPSRLIVYAILGKQFDPGSGPGSDVESAARDVARRILQELHAAE